jgi:L-rhamnonate dehydratase
LDLRGKAAGVPVARLLNRDVDLSRPMETYATVFDDADALEALAAGHRAIKLHVERFGDRPEAKTIADLVERVRAGLSENQPEAGKGGQAAHGTPIMIDAFARWDIDTTLRVAEAVAPLGVDWIEEPLPPDDLDGYALLSEKCPVPIAGGEHEYTADGFRQLIDHRLHAVLQPDVNWCGGLTTLVQIYRMAKDAGLQVCPHRGCEPFALPALAALDPQPLAESPRTWFNCLRGAPQIDRGRITPSAQPGFGVTVDESIWKS